MPKLICSIEKNAPKTKFISTNFGCTKCHEKAIHMQECHTNPIQLESEQECHTHGILSVWHSACMSFCLAFFFGIFNNMFLETKIKVESKFA